MTPAQISLPPFRQRISNITDVRSRISVYDEWPRYLGFYVGMHGLWLAFYAFLGKGFAYAGWGSFFVNELLLLFAIAALCAIGISGILQTRAFGVLMLCFMFWQASCTIPYLDVYGIDALRDGALWGYAFFSFVIAALVVRLPGLLVLMVARYRQFARIYLILGAAAWLASLYLRDSLPHWPETSISIPLIKGGEYWVHLAGILAFVLMGLLSTTPWIWVVLVDSVLGMGVRGGMLAFLISAFFAVILRPRLKRLLPMFACGVLIIVAMAAFDFRMVIPGAVRELSLEQLSNNLTSVIGVSDREDLEGTKMWRLRWWRTIQEYTIYGPYFWTGKGYGINLADSDGFQVGTKDEPLRSPHNSHLTILARSGAPGFALWVLVQAMWISMMLKSYFVARRLQSSSWAALFSWLSAYWIAFLVCAGFDVFLEGPMAAIPFWSLFGFGWGSHILFRRQVALSVGSNCRIGAGISAGGGWNTF